LPLSRLLVLSGFAEMEPRQALVRKDVPRWLKPGSIIEGADMEMHFR
jgi:hypothetical protein